MIPVLLESYETRLLMARTDDSMEGFHAHYSPGPMYQTLQKYEALLAMESKELKAIYHLVESHCPTLRFKTVYRYEKLLQTEWDSKQHTLNAENVEFTCKTENTDFTINSMLKQVEEMPEEWTIVQLTSAYNQDEIETVSSNKQCTNPIHITVFSCGKNQPKPFCVTADAPIDLINGNVMEIQQEMSSIVQDNKEFLQDFPKSLNAKFKSELQKRTYYSNRVAMNNRLQNIVKDVQNYWLKGWRCLLTGKLQNEEEKYINSKLDCLLNELNMTEITEKTRSILKCLMRTSSTLTILELRNCLSYCFPGKSSVHTKIAKWISAFYAKLRKHPVILIIDEALDIFPWEMLDVLQDQSVCRMPSLHFTYALYKEHETSIVDGVKADVIASKGMYIINPGQDLKRMEIRMHNFFKYCAPNWSGLVGTTPSSSEFEDMLLKSDIFSYNGHGNGSQYLSGDKIQRLRINSVVLLFGCSSVKNTYLGPQVEMYGSHQTYLIACSPCVVGMLWEVTDCDTDVFATEFWSRWLPTNSDIHWKNIDRKEWETTGEITPRGKQIATVEENEPELLRALSKARKSGCQFLTRAACVARGIPVKIAI